ncbi:TolC family outer membrane protein [Natronospira bacteriovora]|uniref:TolC family outer membrane protein n=1 Tax=Natronospira bacteriovora TaxID=3069753 RepID=A0ABU0W3D7_9GAMM|nr:TolC family outer membrane protein [Natronospira sp. AB-CW4]MDQ2068532.1 TolC family outer membrane protein [Natronospira sp. AB-CW4]
MIIKHSAKLLVVATSLFAVSLGSIAGPAQRPPDLLTVYELAMENDPRIHQARARLDRLNEARPQARARLLPTVSLSGQMDESWVDGEQIGFDPATQEVGLVDFESNTETTSYGLEVRQTLFRWDAWVGLSEAEARVAEAEAQYDGALQDLLIRVAQAYFDLLLAAENLETRVITREAFEVELERAEFSREVGVASRTDVEEARAAHDRALADEIGAERQLELARERLYEITGRHFPMVSRPRGEIEPAMPEPADIDFWVERAFEHNPELNAARFVAEASGDRVRQARAGRYPTVDLVASRRWVDRSGDNPFQNQDTVNDQIGLQLTVPLFTGGENNSRVREARAAEREAWSGVDLATREVRRSTRDAFLGVRAGVAQVAALRQAVRSSETAVEATEVGVEVGTRSTVDLLNARRELADARARLSEVRYAYLIDSLRLRRAVGQLDADDLRQLAALFLD